MTETPMNKTNTRAPDPQPDFALELARSTARCLFATEWNGFVEVRYSPDQVDDEDDDFVENLPDDVVQPKANRSWVDPETPLAESMTSAEIAAAIGSDCDPFAQSSHAPVKIRHEDDPPPSLVATALAAAQLVDTEAHLHSLFRPGQVTNFTCPVGPFLWGLDQTLPNLIAHWKTRLSSCDAVDLHRIVDDADDGVTRRNRGRKRSMLDTRVERSLAQNASVLLITTDESHLSDALNAIVTRRVAWPGLTPQIVIETLRLTHSVTGQLAEAEIRARLPDPGLLQAFTPGQIDAAFAAPTTLSVAGRLADIAGKLTLPVPRVTLDAVHGLPVVRSALDRMLNDLKAWRSGDLPWSEVMSSAVFHGPPGTGKTTLAKAFAGSAGIPIIETSYSDCQKHGHQGDMLAAVDSAFAEAKQSAPAVLFIDELDGFSQRDPSHQHSAYMRGVVNGLLEQINRANDVDGLILLGATNDLDVVDSAVIRSGRFDLKLHVPYPDKTGLKAILAAKLGSENARRLNLGSLADRLLGLSGAVAEAVVRDGLGRARADRIPVRQGHLDSAADQIAPRLDKDTLRRAAIHEAGHVIAMLQLGWPVPKRVCLTIQGGQVEHAPRHSMTPSTAKEQLQVLLAGRAAEICILETPSSGAGTGAQSDLAQATTLALSIERQWAFGESGLLWEGLSAADVWRAPADVREKTERHLHEAQERALEIVRARKEHILYLAERLLRVREMNEPDIAAFTEDVFREEHGRNDRAPSEGQPSCVSGS
ncbi:AAA family ATPase [Roseovarius pacificus]|uniref:AAA family ATPase n=1 Tax=Roseovarius pacificus TaxID=337701 RepID=UPI0040391B30